MRARYLVGADGARSPVRKAAGVTFDDGRPAYDGPLVPAIGPSLRAGYAFWP